MSLSEHLLQVIHLHRLFAQHRGQSAEADKLRMEMLGVWLELSDCEQSIAEEFAEDLDDLGAAPSDAFEKCVHLLFDPHAASAEADAMDKPWCDATAAEKTF